MEIMLMKNLTILRSAALVLALTTAATAAAGDRSRAPATVEGPWQVTITPVSCATGEEFSQFAFQSLMTFVSGGTLVETTSNPNFQPGQRSPGQGHWERTGRTFYHAYFQAFVQYDSVDPQPPAPFYHRGAQSLDQTIQMQDADHWTSDAQVTFRDLSGAVIYSTGCAKAAAQRMP
jgi:hypothetical protein